MAKKLTAGKKKSILKEFEGLLEKKSDDILLNEIIADRLEAILDKAIDGSLLGLNNNVNEKSTVPAYRREDQSSYIQKTDPNLTPMQQEQINKGVMIMTKGMSQRGDAVKGKG